MNNIDFDRKIKGLVDSYEEPLDVDLWSGIEAGLERRSAAIWTRRVSYAAVAASVVIALVLGINSKQENFTPRGAMAIEVVQPARLDMDVEVPHLLARLNVAERPQLVQSAMGETVAVDEVNTLGTNVAEATENVPPVAVSQANVPVTSPTEEVEEPAAGTAWDESWIYEEEEDKGRRGVVLGVASNMLAMGGGDVPAGGVQYMPGANMAIKDGITPVTKPSFAIPLTFGVQVQFPIGELFAIGTGINYTYLQNSFQALIDNSVQALVNQKIHYIGVPLSLYVNVLKNDHFTCYVSGGAAVEKGLQVSSRIQDLSDGVSYRKEGVKGLQWSANIGIGLQYSFNQLVGIYFDPSLVYFFDSDQPFSMRTTQPFQLDMELGLRFTL
ncbi:MAG: outer membrane beta-barrel protein [Bacteroidales bacterium]|nr:outer membrane beta-barrel protein [Bacteroidales bacterium]